MDDVLTHEGVDVWLVLVISSNNTHDWKPICLGHVFLCVCEGKKKIDWFQFGGHSSRYPYVALGLLDCIQESLVVIVLLWHC